MADQKKLMLLLKLIILQKADEGEICDTCLRNAAGVTVLDGI